MSNTYKTLNDFIAERDALLANELAFNEGSIYLEENQDNLPSCMSNLTSITRDEAQQILVMTISEIQEFLGVAKQTATEIYRSIYPYANTIKKNPNGRTKHAMMQAVARLEVLDIIINTRKSLASR
jgi:hypothetical protein